jgi:hypothetical protein
MKKRNNILGVIACIFACSESKYKPAENVAELTISFIDSKWDGKKVPKSGQCQNCGGEGFSPALLVRNIPKNTNYLIAEFNDKSMPSLSKGGGHGAIRVQIPPKTEFVIPPVKEQTFDLPAGVETESEHKAPLGKSGAYMAPCGCGNENNYEVTIMAVQSEQTGQGLLLGRGKIKLGEF